MDHQFWHDKWDSNQIGFHEESFHPQLCRHWDSLNIAASAPIFVPLCGKSRDMVWLAERGHTVLGVELSEIAAQAFFDENALRVTCDQIGAFKRYHGGAYTILCGDIFDLTMDVLGSFAAVYDRAALIALALATRGAYVAHLKTLCQPRTLQLLITVNYPEDMISPPPYLVSADEVEEAYASWCDLTVLATGQTTIKGIAGTETVYRVCTR
ncbi:MAG: thiopurine S-methyltransferase [Proteobacteria bacterium]|nr:MAG: thiopurine S-methyltransferase [Pseudomonadota bacterium]